MENVKDHLLLNTYPVRHFRWENGFQAFLINNPISPVAAYTTFYTVGSANEKSHQRGLAHFFEHMMFRETEKLKDGEFDRILSELGGVGLNAYTSYDATTYLVNVPSVQLGRVIELEADRMANLQLHPESIEKERGAVLGEIKMYKDMPSEQFWEALMAEAFQEHPYRHPIIGYMDQVAAFDTNDFQSFYENNYAPNRAVVVIAGGFDEDDTLEKLDSAYAGYAPGASLADDLPEEPPWTEGKRLELTHDKITTEFLGMVYRSPGLHHPDLPALVLLMAFLTSGRSSPLYRRLVSGGLATQVSATHMETEMLLVSPGLLALDISLQIDVVAEKAEQAVDEVLRGYLADGIPEAELERARNQIKLSYYSGMRTNMGLARFIGGNFLTSGDPLFGEGLISALDSVTTAEIGKVLKDYLITPPRVVIAQRPGKGKEADPS